ncbi:hypothetical protein [Mycoplasma hafezii]|uniref:hypothetical protein n=1 Tax=Mycoplasma hafezii TaxID=525886 RepID=UPI003CFA9DBC
MNLNKKIIFALASNIACFALMIFFWATLFISIANVIFGFLFTIAWITALVFNILVNLDLEVKGNVSLKTQSITLWVGTGCLIFGFIGTVISVIALGWMLAERNKGLKVEVADVVEPEAIENKKDEEQNKEK